MEEHTNDQPADQPRPPKRRRRRPQGRFSNPASPLQAARFARRANGKEVVAAIRGICPGHGQGPCRLYVSKMSDYENKRRRPSIEHIESFCRYYEKSPEDLGLITWRDQPAYEPGAATPTDPASLQDHDLTHEQLVVDWLRDTVITIATAVFQALTRCPIDLTEEDFRRIVGAPLSQGRDTSENGVLDHDLPDVPAPADKTTRSPRPDPRSNGATEQMEGVDLSAASRDG